MDPDLFSGIVALEMAWELSWDIYIYIKPLSSTSNLDQIGRYRKINSQSVEGF